MSTNRETEPLLDVAAHEASSKGNRSVISNLWTGTAPVTQAGLLLLTILTLKPTLEQDFMLFLVHPPLKLLGLILFTQAILVLQPTSTQIEKRTGTALHALFQAAAFLSFAAGFAVIEANKFRSDGDHFESPHAILGLITVTLLTLQVLVGFTQYYVPSLYGGEESARAVWKYHRAGGYVALLLVMATFLAATKTDFAAGTLGLEIWAFFSAELLILGGLAPRVQGKKMPLF